MIALIAAAGAALLMILPLVRLFLGPTLYDRALAANALIVLAALVAAAIAVAAGRADWLDTALAMIFCALVLNAASLKFFRARTFQAPLMRAEDLR